MKTIILSVIVLGVILGGIAYSNKVEYTAPEIEVVEVEKEVEVDALEEAIKASQEERRADIEAIAQKAHDEAYNQEMKKVELDVIKQFNVKLEARQVELEKETKVYWRDRANIVSLVKQKAEEYGVNAQTMLAVIDCESKYSIDIQSHHTYTSTNVPKGYKVGDREQSFGLVQIHLPAHPNVSKEQATDPEFSVNFLAKNMKTNPNMWSCYKTVAMR